VGLLNIAVIHVEIPKHMNNKDQFQKLQKLIAEIEGQAILFDSDNWPQFQTICVEWGDKVVPSLGPEEKNKFNNELDRLRATIHDPYLPSDFSGAPKSNNFKKMLSIAKQRQYEFELESESSKVPNPTTDPPADITNSEHNWQNKTLYYIAVGVIITVLATFIIYLIKKHFGIPL
jgi:hypothetical protein